MGGKFWISDDKERERERERREKQPKTKGQNRPLRRDRESQVDNFRKRNQKQKGTFHLDPCSLGHVRIIPSQFDYQHIISHSL